MPLDKATKGQMLARRLEIDLKGLLQENNCERRQERYDRQVRDELLGTVHIPRNTTDIHDPWVEKRRKSKNEGHCTATGE
jgi:hypothetical protein